ncbi:chemotaxis protein CheT [Agrobacterium larrymoorei]|uniref:chemotaxis protein CheT n=1 Tax=Agrobacterium larrymoorei TaxID=160699 RepID=UPI0030BD5B76
MHIAERAGPEMFEEALPTILMRVVSELHDVAYLIERIEPQLLDATNGAVTDDGLKLLQGIDLAVQKARGLAEFIDTITGSIPVEWAVDVTTALSLVKLAEMQKALGAGLRHGHSQPIDKASGDFDLF